MLKYLLTNIRGVKILDDFNKKEIINDIDCISSFFNITSFERIKEIENEIKHDVKAVEKYIVERLKTKGLEELFSFVHIGCTSEDINNCAYGLMFKDSKNELWIPKAKDFIMKILDFANNHKDLPMLAHTHGQPATPTTIGKEFFVFAHRLTNIWEQIVELKSKGKFNGATGNYSAISIPFPDYNWPELSKNFIEKNLGLEFNPVTTQIENQDYICHMLDLYRNFINVIADFDLDNWIYISMEYLKQIPVKGEVGSSTMPHKVNPINFENSEGNIKLVSYLLMGLSNDLSRSRMQRDLSGSTMMRNVGMAIGYTLQSIEEASRGLGKVAVNFDQLGHDLDSNWEVLAEPIQTMLRKYGKENAYD